MILAGIGLAFLSGVCNGLFSAPMRLPTKWKWENTWMVFILVACIAMPVAMAYWTAPGWPLLLERASSLAVRAALVFGFAWGFGAISFGQSVDRLGVSVANTLVIGLSSALGSLVPLVLGGRVVFSARIAMLLAGVGAFLIGVMLCGSAGKLRDQANAQGVVARAQSVGYVFAIAAGCMSAVFNIGFALALPMVTTGREMGMTEFGATNVIWLLMLGAGSVPNIVYCLFLMNRNASARLMMARPARPWLLALVMGLLWGGSIFLYGAAVPRLGDIGPSIGWPLSLAVGLVVANLMGILLGEWRTAPSAARLRMAWGLVILTVAIALCAGSTRMAA